jgi:hypothetical protein
MVSAPISFGIFKLIHSINNLNYVEKENRLDGQHCFDVWNVSFVNGSPISQVTFLLGAFLGQNVTFEGMFSFNLSGAG